jgi:hypothetical protein
MSRRVSVFFAFVLLLLCSPSLFAAGEEVPAACPPPADDGFARNWVSTITPLQPTEHVLYPVTDLAGGTLEVRYRVSGQLHLTEVIDLAKVELPARHNTAAAPPNAARKGDAQALVLPDEPFQGVRAVELLTLHPDTMRELHRLANDGVAIEIEILHNGRTRETTSFAELALRTAQLRENPVLPLFAPSVVTGPGEVRSARRLRAATNEYLENCWECTESHPCSTECGYDPGKGGPVTCGEYGAPCEPYCSPSYTSGEWWTGWTFYSTTLSGGHCWLTQSGHRWHNRRLTTYRRERIRRTTTCPNSPSCTGCYNTEAVIQVQYSTSECWENTYSPCFNGDTPCCYRCGVDPWVCGGISCW